MAENQEILEFAGPYLNGAENRNGRNPISFRKLSQIDVQINASKLILIIIFLFILNLSIFFFELYTGKCLTNHLNITEEFVLVRAK